MTYQRIENILTSKSLPWVIIGYGIILRIAQYLHNPSLYIDEARDTVVGILRQPFSGLLNPSYEIFTPSPPLGFFVIEKLAVQFLGNNEYILRLFPLMAGIISLFLFYTVAKRYINSGGLAVSLVLFAVLEPFIYYSSSIRPYSTDVMCALIIFLIADHLYTGTLSVRKIILSGLTGALVIWMSSASVFILAGAGTGLFLVATTKKDWSGVIKLISTYLAWIISFVLCYFLYLSNFTGSEWFLNTFGGEDAFMPLPPMSFSDFKWFMTRFFESFNEFGFYLPGIAAAMFITGCVATYRENKERMLILLLPIIFVLIASGLSLYPFRHRMILFLLPAILLMIAEGVYYIWNKTSSISPLIGGVLTVLLLFHPLLAASHHMIKPELKEHIRPAIHYISENWQEGDVLYIHYRAHPAFSYYAEKYGLSDKNNIVGVYPGDKDNLWAFSLSYLKEYTDDLDKLQNNKRVWVLFSATPKLRKGIDEEVFFNYYLHSIGKELDSFRSNEAAVYLYDLSGQSSFSTEMEKLEKRRPLHWYF